MSKTLRKSFLVTTAAAALVTGLTIASAQTSGGGMKGGAGDHGMSQGQAGGGGGAERQKGPSSGGGAGHAQTQPGSLGTQGHTQRSETGQTGRAMGEERKAPGEQKGTKQLGEQKGNKQLGEQKGTKQLGEQKGTKQLGEQKGNKGTSGQTTTQGRTGQTGFAQGGAQGRVSINEQQRTRIHDVVVNKNFTTRFRASNVNFDVRVGTRIPRSFHLFAVPEDIVVIAPRFRGFRFFIVEDEIVFVDPVTFEIVAVMPV